MFTCVNGGGGNQEKKTNRKIDSMLKNYKNAFKILILGTGDSGKSTFIRQMSYLYAVYTQEDLMPFATVLRDNTLDAMQILLTTVTDLNLPETLLPHVETITNCTVLTPSVADSVTLLWNSKQFQQVLTVAHGINIQGGIFGAKFYFDNAQRFAAQDFVPTKDDTLMARRKTVGINETHFNYEGNLFTLVDVGGQRSERKKWLHCFNTVTAVIYLTAINEYDMVLEEDRSTNRLLESLKLWKALTSSVVFKSTPFILFLNKSDLFQTKIETVPLDDVFMDFKRVTSAPEFAKLDKMGKSWKYIEKQFRTHFEGCRFHSHLTNVLDTSICKKVFIVVQDIILSETLKGFATY